MDAQGYLKAVKRRQYFSFATVKYHWHYQDYWAGTRITGRQFIVGIEFTIICPVRRGFLWPGCELHHQPPLLHQAGWWFEYFFEIEIHFPELEWDRGKFGSDCVHLRFAGISLMQPQNPLESAIFLRMSNFLSTSKSLRVSSPISSTNTLSAGSP